MFDKDRSGHMNLEEFDKLYTYVNQWLAVFKTYDSDQSGSIDENELGTGKLPHYLYTLPPLFVLSWRQVSNIRICNN